MTVTPMALPVFDPDGINAKKTTTRVKVIMTEGMHDTAIITLRNESLDRPELQPGTPVQMQYGWNTVDMEWFYGYVDHIQTVYDRSLATGVTFQDVVCLGVSYTMKDPFVGTWMDIQASTVVRQIVNQYLLALVVDNTDYTWPQLSSPGVSAWTYLNQLGTKVGYSVSCNKSLIRFVSIDTAMRQNALSMPVFKSRRTAPGYLDQSLIRFNALQGETLPVAGHTKAVRQINGVDTRSGQIVAAQDDTTSLNSSLLGSTSVYPFFGEQISSEVVTSQGHAQAVLAGMTQANRWTYQAMASLSGLSSVKQGMPIVLTGIDSNNDGVWWVQVVTHMIGATAYSNGRVPGP